MDGPAGREPRNSGNLPKGRTQNDRHEPGSADSDAAANLAWFKSAVEQLRFVTTMFWQQAGFFLLIQSALLTVVARSLPEEGKQSASLLGLSVLGFALALFWGWVAVSRVKIINRWRDHVVRLDRDLDPHRLYQGEGLLGKYSLRRPTSATMFLPFVLAFGWIVLLLITSGIWSITPNC